MCACALPSGFVYGSVAYIYHVFPALHVPSHFLFVYEKKEKILRNDSEGKKNEERQDKTVNRFNLHVVCFDAKINRVREKIRT